MKPRQAHLALLKLVLVLAVAAATGCTKLGPDFVRPEAQVQDEWLELEDPVIEGDPVDYGDWWQAFNDPVLSELVDLAYKQNLDLQITALRILQSRAELGIAIGSLYPQQQQGFGSTTANQRSENAAGSSPQQEDFGIDYNLGFGLAWELDFFGRFRRGVESADAVLLASIATYEDLLVSLTAEVANAYTQVRTSQEQIRIAKRNVEIQRRSLQIATVRFRNGVVTELDVQQATSLLRETQASVPVFEADLRRAKNALAVLIGRPPGAVDAMVETEAPIPVAPPAVMVGMPADLLRRRPDVRAAEFAAAAQSARIGVARTDLFPRFTLLGEVGLRSSGKTRTTKSGDNGINNLFDGNAVEYSVGPSFTWNLFNYGRLTNNVRAQDALFEQFAVDYQNAVLRAAQEVENGLVGFLRSQESADFLDKSVRASRRSVELALVQYRDGVVDYQRVLDTQRDLVNSEQQFTTARGDIAFNLIETYRALGGGWEIAKGQEVLPEVMRARMEERTNWGGMLQPAVYVPPPAEEATGDWRWPDW